MIDEKLYQEFVRLTVELSKAQERLYKSTLYSYNKKLFDEVQAVRERVTKRLEEIIVEMWGNKIKLYLYDRDD